MPIVLIAAAGLLLTVPALVLGFPANGHDSLSHLIRYTHFSSQLWNGELYPRWLIDMNLGLGSPSMFFYPPVGYYLTSLLRPLFVADPNGWYQLATASSLILIASGLAMYGWLRTVVDRTPALIAAIIYMALPYHLGADLYVRGALSEYCAFIWMPLIPWLVSAVARGGDFSAVMLSAANAVLFMTHPKTARGWRVFRSGALVERHKFITVAREKHRQGRRRLVEEDSKCRAVFGRGRHDMIVIRLSISPVHFDRKLPAHCLALRGIGMSHALVPAVDAGIRQALEINNDGALSKDAKPGEGRRRQDHSVRRQG